MKYININRKQLHMIIAAVIAVTLISVLLALLLSSTYKNSAAADAQKENLELSAFFADSIRTCPDPSKIRTAKLGGDTPALVIPCGDPAEEDNELWLFSYKGYLRRSKTSGSGTVEPENALIVAPAAGLNFRMLKPGLLEIIFTSEDDHVTVLNMHLPYREVIIHE